MIIITIILASFLVIISLAIICTTFASIIYTIDNVFRYDTPYGIGFEVLINNWDEMRPFGKFLLILLFCWCLIPDLICLLLCLPIKILYLIVRGLSLKNTTIKKELNKLFSFNGYEEEDDDEYEEDWE